MAGCGGGDGAGPDAGPLPRDPAGWAALPPDQFCQAALGAVDAFLGAPGSPSEAASAHVVQQGGLADGRSPDRPAERYGGTAVVASLQELRDGLSGFFGTHYRSAQHQLHVGLMPLVRRGPELEPEPWLAESWSLGEDGTSLTFVLRDDVLWHDGTPVTPADVVFTFLRLVDERTGSPAAAFFQDYLVGEGNEPVVEGRSVTFRFRPHPEPLSPWTTLAIMPAHLLGEVDPGELRSHPYALRCPVGNGPFVFVEHLQDQRWSFRANPVFPQGLGGRPYLDGYVYRTVIEPSTLLTELLTGRVDLVPRLSLDQAERVEEDPEVRLLSSPGSSYLYVAWNQRPPGVLLGHPTGPAGAGAVSLTDGESWLRDQGRTRCVLAPTGIPPSHPAWIPRAPGFDLHDPQRARASYWTGGVDSRQDSGAGPAGNQAGKPLDPHPPSMTHANQEQGDNRPCGIQPILDPRLGVEVELRSLEFGTLLSRAEAAGRDFF